jgi:hypothetical protein
VRLNSLILYPVETGKIKLNYLKLKKVFGREQKRTERIRRTPQLTEAEEPELNRAQLKLYHEFPLLFVGGCVGVSAVVSFGFAVGAGFDVRVTAGFAVSVKLD